MNRAGPVFERVVEAMAHRIADRAQPLDPFLVRIELFALRRFARLAQKFAAIGNDAEFNIAVAPDLLGLDIDLDHACVARNHRVAPAGEHPNPRAKQDYQVGAAAAFRMDRGMNRAEASEAQRMLFGDRAARLGVGHHRGVGKLGKARQFRRGLREPYSAAGKDRGTLGLAKPVERLRERGSAGTGGLLGPIIFGKLDSFLIDAREQHIDRQLEEHRPGAA